MQAHGSRTPITSCLAGLPPVPLLHLTGGHSPGPPPGHGVLAGAGIDAGSLLRLQLGPEGEGVVEGDVALAQQHKPALGVEGGAG